MTCGVFHPHPQCGYRWLPKAKCVLVRPAIDVLHDVLVLALMPFAEHAVRDAARVATGVGAWLHGTAAQLELELGRRVEFDDGGAAVLALLNASAHERALLTGGDIEGGKNGGGGQGPASRLLAPAWHRRPGHPSFCVPPVGSL